MSLSFIIEDMNQKYKYLFTNIAGINEAFVYFKQGPALSVINHYKPLA